MSASDSRTDDARAAIEHAINEFSDVFVNDDDGKMHMPVLSCWILMTTHDDGVDPTILAAYRMSRKNMATHETAGMLYLALQELGRPWEPD